MPNRWDELWKERPQFSADLGFVWPAAWHLLYFRRRYLSVTERLATARGVDVYIVTCWLIGIAAAIMLSLDRACPCAWIACAWVGLRYADILGIQLQVLVMRRESRADIAAIGRTFLLSVTSVLEISLLAGILYFYLDSHWPSSSFFHARFAGLLDALYLSAITGATVGYGDNYPTHWLSKILTMSHVFSMLLILTNMVQAAAGAKPLKSAEGASRR